MVAFASVERRWDKKSGNLAVMDGLTKTEFGDPLLITLETGPIGVFPEQGPDQRHRAVLTKALALLLVLIPRRPIRIFRSRFPVMAARPGAIRGWSRLVAKP